MIWEQDFEINKDQSLYLMLNDILVPNGIPSLTETWVGRFSDKTTPATGSPENRRSINDPNEYDSDITGLDMALPTSIAGSECTFSGPLFALGTSVVSFSKIGLPDHGCR